jgi:hypothetical protein
LLLPPHTHRPQIRIIDADTGAEAINSDLLTMQNITLQFTKPRWVAG